jgi:hypothetical protein
MRYEVGDGGEIGEVFDESGSHTRTNCYQSPECAAKMVMHTSDKYAIDFVTFFDDNLLTLDGSPRGTWLSEICRHDF